VLPRDKLRYGDVGRREEIIERNRNLLTAIFAFLSHENSSKLAPYDYEDNYNPFEHRVVDKPNS
jgi:hypothetical protein